MKVHDNISNLKSVILHCIRDNQVINDAQKPTLSREKALIFFSAQKRLKCRFKKGHFRFLSWNVEFSFFISRRFIILASVFEMKFPNWSTNHFKTGFMTFRFFGFSFLSFDFNDDSYAIVKAIVNNLENEVIIFATNDSQHYKKL